MGLFTKNLKFSEGNTQIDDFGDGVTPHCSTKNGVVGNFYLHFPLFVDDNLFFQCISRSSIIKDSGFRNYEDLKKAGHLVLVNAVVEKDCNVILELETHCQKKELNDFFAKRPLQIVRTQVSLSKREKEELRQVLDKYIQRDKGLGLEDYLKHEVKQEELDAFRDVAECIRLAGDCTYDPKSNSVTFPVTFVSSPFIPASFAVETMLGRSELPEALGYTDGCDMWRATEHMDALHAYLTFSCDKNTKEMTASMELAFEDGTRAASKQIAFSEAECKELGDTVYAATRKTTLMHIHAQKRKLMDAKRGTER